MRNKQFQVQAWEYYQKQKLEQTNFGHLNLTSKEAQWCINVSVNWIIIGSGQIITWTNVDPY